MCYKQTVSNGRWKKIKWKCVRDWKEIKEICENQDFIELNLNEELFNVVKKYGCGT